jgi:hypothetical protein
MTKIVLVQNEAKPAQVGVNMRMLVEHDKKTYLTIKFPCNVESHKGENDAYKAQSSCGDIHD